MLNIIMLREFMVNVITLSVVMLNDNTEGSHYAESGNAARLSVRILIFVMLNAMAPLK